MHSPHCANEPDATLPARGAVNNPNEDVFADSLQTPHKGESEEEEGNGCGSSYCKETLCIKPTLSSTWHPFVQPMSVV